MKKKRIQLNKIQLTSLSNESATPPGDDNAYLTINPELILKGEYVSGFTPALASSVIDDNGKVHPEISGWPEKTISLEIPDDDMPRVKGWFSDNYQGVTKPESATLTKNIQNAVFKLMNDYDSATANHNLFHHPCKFAWCLRDSEGVRTPLLELIIEHPNRNAPSLPIINHYFVDNQLYTKVQIRNVASKLMYKISTDDLSKMQNSGYDTIEFYATRQSEYRPIKSEILGISTVNIDSTPTRCWSYDKYSADEIVNSTMGNVDFRRICSLPISELKNEEDFKNLPILSGLLANFSNTPKYSASDGSGIGSENGNNGLLENKDDADCITHFLTEPMAMDLPEDDKHVRKITLFGIFNRLDSRSVRMKIYASHHRDHWHLIAATNGAIIHGLRRAPYRWWRVEILANLRPGDRLEAITFCFET